MILEELKKNNIIKKGIFQLKSGEISDTYIDLKRVISFPQLHKKICDLLMCRIKYNYISLLPCSQSQQQQTLICGTPYGAISYVSYISIQTNIPMIFLRKEQKHTVQKTLLKAIIKKTIKLFL